MHEFHRNIGVVSTPGNDDADTDVSSPPSSDEVADDFPRSSSKDCLLADGPANGSLRDTVHQFPHVRALLGPTTTRILTDDDANFDSVNPRLTKANGEKKLHDLVR